MQQFFTPDIDLDNKTYSFNEVESKHIAKVLRKKSGDTLRLTNGKGALIWGQLELVTPKENQRRKIKRRKTKCTKSI